MENQLDQKLGILSKLVSHQMGTHSSDNSSTTHMMMTTPMNIETLESEIEQLLSQLQSINQEIRHLINSASNVSQQFPSSNEEHDDNSVEMPSHLIFQRDQHTQVLHNLQQEYKRIRHNINRAYILNEDYSERSRQQPSSSLDTSNDNSWTSMINRTMKDRDTVVNIDALANELLDSAHSTRGSLSQQRTLMTGAGAKLTGMRTQLPLIDSIIGRIQQRRQRDMIILSFFIAFCIIITWFLL
jgi:Golgi SNAP receptor complex protein 1